MAKLIYKYPIENGTVVLPGTLTLPKGSTILSCAVQDETGMIWALVDPQEEEQESYRIVTMRTGYDYMMGEASYAFLGTLLFSDGAYVEHIFYRKD